MSATIFWSLAAVMALIAVVPIFRVMRAGGSMAIPAVVAAAVVAVSVGTYLYLNEHSFEELAAASGAHSPGDQRMIESLAARLERDPEDIEGWKFLGRSYRAQGQYRKAAEAFEQAYEREGDDDPMLMLDLGEALIFADNAAIDGRAGQLFENALAVAPANSRALWYAGLAAARRGERLLAADRWEAILSLSPPPDVRQILETNIAQLRGEMDSGVPADEAVAAVSDSPGAASSGPTDETTPPVAAEPGTVPLEVRLSPELAGAAPSGATLFIFARTPGVGGPPIAVIRRSAGELPLSLSLSDANAMMAGRKLSTEEELLLVARVSKSGTPAASAGDLFGELIYRMDSGQTAELIIDQVVGAN